MLLRRIIEHVKTQNWTAVALDFVIVVVGVFMGLQLGNWNEHRIDQQRAENYLERLTQEMSINQQSLSSRRESYATQIEYGLFAVGTTAPPTDREEAWIIVRSFFQASHAFPISLQRGTYDEIISSGDLALLNDQELVSTLSDFYTFGGFSTINLIPDYRENIRRVIPFQLQRYLQTQCYEITLPDTHRLLDCAPPSDFSNLIKLATELQTNDELKRDLQYMLSYAGVSTDIARNRKSIADKLLAILSTKTSPKGH